MKTITQNSCFPLRKLPSFILISTPDEKITAIPYIEFIVHDVNKMKLHKILNDRFILKASNRQEYKWEETLEYHTECILGNMWFESGNDYNASECLLSWLIISEITEKNKKIDSKVIGRAGIKEDEDFNFDEKCSNIYLGITYDYQKKGLGTKFIQELLKWWCHTFPSTTLQWVSQTNNEGSKKLAKNVGFIPIRTVNLEHDYVVFAFRY